MNLSAAANRFDTAQQASAANWIEAYQKYVNSNPPSNSALVSLRNTAIKSPSSDGQVWVNTRSKKYWKPGSRFYGKTKQGEYMTELEAIQNGNQPANGTGE